jgi:hypothetical protein
MLMLIDKPRIAAAAALALAAALFAAGCNDHSLSLTLTPNPVIVGLVDTSATIHAHVVARGFGTVPISTVQFAVFNDTDEMLASQTQQVDANLPSSPLGYVIDKDYTFPINGAAVALSGTKYLMVKVLDPTGNVIAQSRVDVVVHALKGLPLPSVVQPAASPAPR